MRHELSHPPSTPAQPLGLPLAPRPDALPGNRSRLRVLCVSDDPDHAELVHFALEQIPVLSVDFRCERILSRAVEIPAVSPVDAVFIDVGPRSVNSPSLALATEVALVCSIRETGYRGLLVVLTVETDLATVIELEDAGADACLRRRDLRPERLEQIIRTAAPHRFRGQHDFLHTTPTQPDDLFTSFGVRAVSSADPRGVLTDACRTVANALTIDLVGAFELDAARQVLVLVAGHGWEEGDIGTLELASSKAGEPAVETLTGSHRVVRGISTAIQVGGHSWGVLAAFSRSVRRVLPREIRFVATVARLAGAAFERERAEARQRRAAVTLAAEIAYLLRQPLQAIRLQAALLLGNGLGIPERQAVEKIEKETRRCDHVLGQALGLATSTRESSALGSLNDAVHEAVVAALAYAQRPVDLIENLAPDLPLVDLEPAAVEQLTISLLVNAIEASPEHGPVTVRTSAAPGGVRLTVEDRGCGIDAGVRERMFEPFVTTKQKISQNGLGLSVVRRIVQHLQGTIDVESARGRGTSISIQFPLAIGAQP